MILYPAIDLKDGQCVRLIKGDMDKATVFSDSPADQAAAFEAAGADWLHLVDLNGAFEGKPVNAAAVEAILDRVSIPAQLGGGIRDIATMEFWINRGIQRLILGTLALRNPEIVKEACNTFPGQIAVGIDARDGFVAVEGWAETSEMTAIDLARKFEDAGVAAIIYTDIDRDGMMQGANIESTIELANATSIPVILSGGVSSIGDLETLKTASSKAAGTIDGAISGRALYDGKLDLSAALKLLKDA